MEVAGGSNLATWRPGAVDQPELETAVFDRVFDDLWRRTSYSGITADAHDPRVGSEPDDQHLVSDEPRPTGQIPERADDGSEAERARLGSIELPLSQMPGGVEVGSFIHGVLEETDFAAADIGAEISGAVGAAMSRARDRSRGPRARGRGPVGRDRDTARCDRRRSAICATSALRPSGRADVRAAVGRRGDRPGSALCMPDIADVIRATSGPTIPSTHTPTGSVNRRSHGRCAAT